MERNHVLTVLVAGLLVATTLMTAGCISEPEGFKGTVRVGWLTGDLHHLPYFVAKNATVGGGESFFDQHGVKVADAQAGGYANGGTEMDFFGKGNVDMGLMGAPPAITKHINADINTTVVGVVNEIGSAIVVKPSIKDASDLKGKTILTPGASTIQHFLLLEYLKQNNMTVSDLTIEAGVAPNIMRSRLEAGSADGFIAWEPFCEDAVVAGVGTILIFSKDIWPNHLCCVVTADWKFADKHGDVVVNYLKAHKDAIEWINHALEDNTSADYHTLVDIAVGFTGRPAEVVELALQNMRYEWRITPEVQTFFTEFAQGLLDFGVIKQSDLEARGYANATDLTDKYMDTHFLDKASK
jgi:NitT/TauT family transport system substrate-binding protein